MVQFRTKSIYFTGDKIGTTTSFGGEIKQSANSVRFYGMLKNSRGMNRQNYRQNSRTFLAMFLPVSLLGVSAETRAENSGG
jgi:hypothetical protein